MKNNKSESKILSQKLEELLKKNPSNADSHLSENGMSRLVHELEVYQIELKMQTENHMLANERLEKAATDKYAKLYDFAPAGYLTLSTEGAIMELNLRGALMLGKDRPLLINSRVGFFISNDTRSTFNLFLEKAFLSKAEVSCEVVISTNDNLPMSVLLTGIVTGNEEQCFVTMVDITRRKRAEEELISANRELETFSYSVSHDLKTPLRHINGFIALFLESKSTQLTEEELGYLKKVTGSATTMGQLIDAILSFSKLSMAELQKSKISSSAMVQQVINYFKPEMQNRNITFNIESLPDADGDADLMRQVWTNLISNAIKYSGKKPDVVIEIGGISTDSETIFL